MKAIEARDFDLAIIDLNYTRDTTSGQEGLDLLAKLQAADATMPVVVMTSWAPPTRSPPPSPPATFVAPLDSFFL